MEFKEFTNPLEEDYDINSSLKAENVVQENNSAKNIYADMLRDLVGFLEDGEWEYYGISFEEYLNPTKETVLKVKAKLEEAKESGRKR